MRKVKSTFLIIILCGTFLPDVHAHPSTAIVRIGTEHLKKCSSFGDYLILFFVLFLAIVILYVFCLLFKKNKEHEKDAYYQKIAEQIDNKTDGKKTNSSFDLTKEEAEYRRLRKNVRFKKEK